MKYGIKLNNCRLVCHIRNADRNQTISPKPILMRTNVHQNLEDEKAENRHFRIGPLPQYARVLSVIVFHEMAAQPDMQRLNQGVQQMGQGLRAMSQELTLIGNIPAIAGGQAILAAIQTLDTNLSQRLTTLDNRLTALDNCVTALDTRVTTLDTNITQRLANIENQI